jgi:hypothetical protein
MTLETMKGLFGITYVRYHEVEVPNVKRRHVGEEEASLSQAIIAAVPHEEGEVPVLQGLHRLPPEEEDILVPLERPPVVLSPEEEVP